MTISPLYTIHKYREDTFKVVCFKRNLDSDGLALRVRDPDEFQHNETKLDNNLSRARSMVLQYALCNLWEWFFTGTLDKRKYDRFNLDKYMIDLPQWVRDMFYSICRYQSIVYRSLVLLPHISQFFSYRLFLCCLISVPF